MPLENAELLEPIPGDNPGGEYLRYDPIYDQIRVARTEEADLPSGEWERERKTADYALVARLAHEVLATRSKDLQVAAWLAEALLKREGFAGLAASLDLIRALLENFWDHLYPELEDGDAEMRAAPLIWLGGYLGPAVRTMPIVQDGYDMAAYKESRVVGYDEDATTYEARDIRNAAIAAGKLTAEEFDAAFAATPKAWYRTLVDDMDRALAVVAELAKVSDEKFAQDAPNYAPLADAIRDLRQVAAELLAKKLEREPDPVEAAPEAVTEDVVAEAPTPSTRGSAPPAAPSGVQIPAVFAATPPPSGGRAGAEASVAAAARFLRRENPADPGSYLMLRGLRWGELRAGGGPIDPALLAAPPTEVRARVKGLLLQESWEDLLDAAEEVMATSYGRGWLDLQRYTVTATDALSGEYAAVGNAVRGALRQLLSDHPELPALTLADDTATANAETRGWLRTEGLLPAEEAGAAADEAPPPPRRSRLDVLGRARDLATNGREGEAVDLLMREAEQERSHRGRFLRRMEAAAILVEAGRPLVALPILEELSETITEHNLERWEDAATVARALGLLYRCHLAIDGDASSVHELFVRVCRLDPLQAMQIGPGAPQG